MVTMSNQKRSKINLLMSQWPKGTLATTAFLHKNEIDKELIKRYKKSNWIEMVSNGVYKLPDDDIDWYGALYAIQRQLNLSIHPGGKTALQLLGYSHYLAETLNKLYLFGYRGTKLPTWYRKYDWKVNTNYSANQVFPEKLSNGYTENKYKKSTIKITSAQHSI